MQGKPLDIIAWKIKKVFGPKNNTQNVTNIIGKYSLQTERNLYYPPSIWVHSTKRDHIPPIGKRKTHFGVSFLRDTCFFDAEKTRVSTVKKCSFPSSPTTSCGVLDMEFMSLRPEANVKSASTRPVGVFCCMQNAWYEMVRNGNYSNSLWEPLGK